MFLSLMKYLSGYLRVRVTGYAPERFLNLCSNHNILMWQLMRVEDGYEFYISVKGFRQLKPYLKKTRTKICILTRNGFPFKVYRYRKRKLFFGGIVVFFLFLFLLSRYIWNIEIVGNSSVTDDNLLKFLESEDCGFGVRKSTIDCSGLEEEIRLKYTNIIWTSAQISGTKLTIQVKENLVSGSESKESENQACDIVASGDGVIKSIVTRSGTPLVKAGDKVKAGDILVSGRIDIYNDNAEVAGYHYCRADADIYCDTSINYNDQFNREYQKRRFTGNIKNRYAIKIANKAFKLPMPGIPYKLYEKATDFRQLNVCSDFYLPFTWCSEQYQEYVLDDKKYTNQQMKEIANKHLDLYLEKIKEKNIQIIEKNVIIDLEKNYCKASGTISTCEKFDKTAATEVMPDPVDEGLEADELE